jgi:hypothetical protein
VRGCVPLVMKGRRYQRLPFSCGRCIGTAQDFVPRPIRHGMFFPVPHPRAGFYDLPDEEQTSRSRQGWTEKGQDGPASERSARKAVQVDATLSNWTTGPIRPRGAGYAHTPLAFKS